jgi:hypothetical protein
MVATENEIAMEVMVDGHGKRTHESEPTKAMGTRRIPENYEDTRVQRGITWFVLRWVSRVFSLFSLHHQG